MSVPSEGVDQVGVYSVGVGAAGRQWAAGRCKSPLTDEANYILLYLD